MVRHMEESGDDGGISSAFNTPMDDISGGGIYPAGSAPSSAGGVTSSSLGRNSSSLSSKTASSVSPHAVSPVPPPAATAAQSHGMYFNIQAHTCQLVYRTVCYAGLLRT